MTIPRRFHTVITSWKDPLVNIQSHIPILCFKTYIPYYKILQDNNLVKHTLILDLKTSYKQNNQNTETLNYMKPLHLEHSNHNPKLQVFQSFRSLTEKLVYFFLPRVTSWLLTSSRVFTSKSGASVLSERYFNTGE
jgi:hypothetical protein